MSYYLIDNTPIYLTTKKYNNIKNIISEGKNSEWKIGSSIYGTAESIEKHKLIYNYLKELYEENKQEFLKEWFHFDLKKDEAESNTWNLLYDFCDYYGYSYLTDLRDFASKTNDDRSGNNRLHPMGEVFGFTHSVRPKKWWWKYKYKMEGRTINFVIDVKTVTSINGNLTDFNIFLDKSIIKLNKNIEIAWS